MTSHLLWWASLVSAVVFIVMSVTGVLPTTRRFLGPVFVALSGVSIATTESGSLRLAGILVATAGIGLLLHVLLHRERPRT